jgi:hypothetical protein
VRPFFPGVRDHLNQVVHDDCPEFVVSPEIQGVLLELHQIIRDVTPAREAVLLVHQPEVLHGNVQDGDEVFHELLGVLQDAILEFPGGSRPGPPPSWLRWKPKSGWTNSCADQGNSIDKEKYKGPGQTSLK